MQFFRARAPSMSSYEPEVRVVKYIATRRSDAERGPMVWLHSTEVEFRVVVDGELVWIHTPNGSQQLATLRVDDTLALHTCVLRDIPGVMLSEAVRITKPDLDSPNRSLFV